MEVKFGQNSVDEPNLLYKLQRKIRVFNTNHQLLNRGYNLVANSSKYGLVFVAVPDGILTVYYLSQLVDKECEPQHMKVKLQESPTHIAVSCDHELLAVTGGQLLSIYKVVDFQQQNVAAALIIPCKVNPSTFVSAMQWNPCIPDSIAIAYYDGTLLACQVASGQTKKVPSKARCICWSPKGKQLVTGNSDGTLIQYKPDLTPAKIVPAPNLFEGCPIEALAIYWISTFQFAVVYKNSADNSRPAVTIVFTPKAGQPFCSNFEDICYSMGSNRPWYYYLQGLAQWNIIMSSSSNSMEISTLGSEDGCNWLQWCQPDEARPELPLTDKKQENYPVGISVDTCAIHQLPWGENETLSHMPLMHVISQTGLLTIFNIINLRKDAVQVCTQPQQIALPANVMTSGIPGEVPVHSSTPAPKPVPQVPQQELQPQAAPQQPVNQFATSIKIPSFTPQGSQGFSAVPASQIATKPVVEDKPVPVPQPQVTEVKVKSQPVPQAVAKPTPTPQQVHDSAALKAAQDKANKAKANQELKNMLVKEVNDFQMELYNFMVKTKETQARLQRDIDSICSNFTDIPSDTEKLKKECSIDELREAIVQLKLELVRACAVVAEARTHSENKELHEWTQADPLTTKRVASVKKLAYYVQSQLEQAHKALDHKWNEMTARDLHSNKPGRQMIRPILDDVYQPLVKQQEILSRQQAVLRTLKNTLKDCDEGPVFKSTSLLRSTPFRNKDPLSKLTKNILNMSIEPQTKPKQPMFTPQKLDTLRDMLSNHKTVKIKPVNIELRQHLDTMRQNYERSLKEKAQMPVKTDPDVKSQVIPEAPPATVKTEPVKTVTSAPAFTPVSNLKPKVEVSNVARILFTNEPKKALPVPQTQQPQGKPTQSGFDQPTPIIDTKSVLKDLLQTKSQANLEPKNSNNMFMGQSICSPYATAQSSAASVDSAPSAVFTSNLMPDVNSMPNKHQPQAITLENKSNLNLKSNKTGELQSTNEEPKPFEFKPKDKPTPFGLKNPVAASTPIVNDVIKNIQEKKHDSKVTQKSIDKSLEKTKENVPDKASDNIPVSVMKSTDKKETVKPLSAQTANRALSIGSFVETVSATSVSSNDSKSSDSNFEKPTSTSSSVSSVSAPKPTPKPQSPSTLKPQIIKIDFVPSKPDVVATKTETTSPQTEVPLLVSETKSNAEENKKEISAPKIETQTITSETPKSKTETTVKTDESDTKSIDATASSIFGAAAAAQPKSTSLFPTSPGSIFTSSPVFGSTEASSESSSSIFGTTTSASAIFGQTNTTQSVFTSTAASVFASAASQSSETPSTTKSVFSASTTIASLTTTSSSIFSSGTSTSLFGAPTTSVQTFGTSTASIFGTGTATTTASVFGTSTTQASAFETTTAPSAFTPTTSSVFATVTTAANIFSSSTTQASSVFGQAAQTVFGTTSTTQASIFGGQSPVFGSTTTQASVFGTTTPTTQSSVFGSSAQTTQASIFGTPTQITQASVFGTPTQANQASMFGSSPQTTQASIFGAAPATTTQSSSWFGGDTNIFAAATISTTSAPASQTSGGNIFGSGSTTGSVFGNGSTNVFGGKTAFGQTNATAVSIFGGASTTFGQKPAAANSIWGSETNTATAFGSSGFGQAATTQASSIFGGSTGGSFSTPSAGAFGSPQQPSAFGSPQQQQAPAFGGSPVFGSKPVFGQSTGFGSAGGGFGAAATFSGFNKSPGGFGAAAAFGGAATAFGGNTSPGAAFSSPTQQSNATFESLATQNTLTFGNLAQQSNQPLQPAAPSFNTSPSFSGWRG